MSVLPLEHEELLVRRGARSGVDMAIAVHSTTLGRALGGLRIWHYPSSEEGIADALRLSRAMTMKAAAAGLDFGGGKGVICTPHAEPPAGELREATLLDFGDLVEALEGRYFTAEDVGSSATDLVAIRARTRNVVGLPVEYGGSGDPSPSTARGVEAAMRACARARFGSDDLSGVQVAVVGLGNVGSRLARRLAAHGARLVVSDIDDSKLSVAAELDMAWIEPDAAITAECDILAPCALGGAISEEAVEGLRCEIVCGSANNQLAGDRVAESLAEHGILYAPDFIVNAGGLISVSRELNGRSPEATLRLIDGIEGAMERILAIAEERSLTPLEAAAELSTERLAERVPTAAVS